MKILTALILTMTASGAFANINWLGSWQLSSPKACSTNDMYEDALFGHFMKDYSWTFDTETTVQEWMRFEQCDAKITYQVEFLPRTSLGNTGHMNRMKLTRKSFESTCLRQDARPVSMELAYVAYPNFFETYEPIESPQGPCPMGTYVVTQFKKVDRSAGK